MAEETLTSAYFEPIKVDGLGKFDFTDCLVALRRSMKGMHNKIQPVFIINDVKNPVNTIGMMKPNSLQTIRTFEATGVNTGTSYAVPGSDERFYLTNVVITNLALVPAEFSFIAGGTSTSRPKLRGWCPPQSSVFFPYGLLGIVEPSTNLTFTHGFGAGAGAICFTGYIEKI